MWEFLKEFHQLFKILTCRRVARDSAGRDQRTPIVFIHGLNGRKSNWNHLLNCLDQAGSSQLGRFYAISLPSGNHSIAEDVRVAALEIRYLARESPTGSVHLVGHSRGGLVALFCAEKLLREQSGRVETIVTIAAPLRGTPWANWGRKFLSAFSLRACDELALQSHIAAQVQHFSKERKARVLHLVAARDFLVPTHSAQLQENASQSIQTGHLGILTHSQTAAALLRWWRAQPGSQRWRETTQQK